MNCLEVEMWVELSRLDPSTNVFSNTHNCMTLENGLELEAPKGRSLKEHCLDYGCLLSQDTGQHYTDISKG